jgi:hypothetical protein
MTAEGAAALASGVVVALEVSGVFALTLGGGADGCAQLHSTAAEPENTREKKVMTGDFARSDFVRLTTCALAVGNVVAAVRPRRPLVRSR